MIKKIRILNKTILKNYTTLSAEDYQYNQRDASLATNLQFKKLLPLQNSNHGEGTTDEIELIGVPYGKIKEKFEDYTHIQSAFERNHPDLVFLQLDPSAYIARQRFLAHKCALKEVEDYDKKAIDFMDPCKPFSWEECVVNLVVLDMLKNNQTHDKLEYRQGFCTYSYPYLQDQQNAKTLQKPFINSISENLINQQFSEYYLINQVLFQIFKALYTSLLGKQKVILGGMPETLSRQIIGNSVSIEEMRDLFKFVITKMKDFNVPIGIKTATEFLLPHIFYAPKDLYMSALLKESFQAATTIIAFVGINHFLPIQRSWQPAPRGINYSQATQIPERIRGESDEQQIEKQAIMDVLLETRVWGQNFISNSFPYLTQDITSVQQNDLDLMKKCFLTNFQKYESFKNQKAQQLDHSTEINQMKLIQDFYKDKPIDLKSIKFQQ